MMPLASWASTSSFTLRPVDRIWASGLILLLVLLVRGSAYSDM